jgi:hypothetical protein
MSSYTISSKERIAPEAVVISATEALKTLYDLLEAHAPSWYKQEHHDKAKAALHKVERQRRGEVHVR